MKVLMGRTPWGDADSVTELGNGVLHVTTSSHGGIYVPRELLGRIPAEQRQWAKSWSGSEQWYEEDCCWAAVAVAFPELFGEQQELARQTLQRYFPEK